MLLFLIVGSIGAYFILTDTLAEGLLSGNWFERLMGLVLIGFMAYFWYVWFTLPA